MSRAKCNRKQVPTELHVLVQLGHLLEAFYTNIYTQSMWEFTVASTACSFIAQMNER
jgi:hypothetical protein